MIMDPYLRIGHSRFFRFVDGRFFLGLESLHGKNRWWTCCCCRISPQTRTQGRCIGLPIVLSHCRPFLRHPDDHRPVRQAVQGSAELPHAHDFCRHLPRHRRHAARCGAHYQALPDPNSERQPALQRTRGWHLSLELYRHHFFVFLRLRGRRPLPSHQNVPARIRPLPLLTVRGALVLSLLSALCWGGLQSALPLSPVGSGRIQRPLFNLPASWADGTASLLAPSWPMDHAPFRPIPYHHARKRTTHKSKHIPLCLYRQTIKRCTLAPRLNPWFLPQVFGRKNATI